MHSDKYSDLNTFNSTNVNDIYFRNKVTVEVNTLEKILDKVLFEKQKSIGFLSIDVEGHDLNVLKSNNWDKYRPSIVLIEFVGSMSDVYKSPIYEYLNELAYEPISKISTNVNFGNLLFVDKKVNWIF